MKFEIFISYRRSDSGAAIGRLHDHLAERFGKNALFRDTQAMPFGEPILERVTQAIRGSKVMLAVIGPEWADVRDKSGERRLGSAADYVRQEIECALACGIHIIPVLLNSAEMPREDELPESISRLAQLSAADVRLSDPDFADDVRRLGDAISPILGAQGTDERAAIFSGRDALSRVISPNFLATYKEYCFRRYGGIRILGMSKALELQQIYTRARIYTQLRRSKSKTMDEALIEVRTRQHLDEAPLDARDAVLAADRVVLLGRPGSGKSTFLKALLLHELQSSRATNVLPVIVVATELLKNRQSILSDICNTVDLGGGRITPEVMETFLSDGGVRLLIDGLDEVRAEERVVLVDEITRLSTRYPKTKITATCRTAAYDYWFSQFDHYEVAEFSQQQVVEFVDRWYASDDLRGKELQRQIRINERIFSMCANPLMATIICIAFDDGVDVSSSRVEVYKDAIEALLKKWDASRNVFRDNMYANISMKRRQDLLCDLAIRTFVEDQIFIPERRAAEIVEEFLAAAPERVDGANVDAIEVLRAIEAQHGLIEQKARSSWAFAHLTFQEYFVALYACSRDRDLRRQIIDRAFDDADWREVLILIASLLPNADDFVIDLLKAMTRLNYGFEYVRRVEDEINRAIQARTYQRERIDLTKDRARESADGADDAQSKPTFRVIDGGPVVSASEAAQIIRAWRIDASAEIGSIKFDDAWLERLIRSVASIYFADETVRPKKGESRSEEEQKIALEQEAAISKEFADAFVVLNGKKIFDFGELFTVDPAP